mgnify:CR=1 FL=1
MKAFDDFKRVYDLTDIVHAYVKGSTVVAIFESGKPTSITLENEAMALISLLFVQMVMNGV